jgi:hypothetical protein
MGEPATMPIIPRNSDTGTSVKLDIGTSYKVAPTTPQNHRRRIALGRVRELAARRRVQDVPGSRRVGRQGLCRLRVQFAPKGCLKQAGGGGVEDGHAAPVASGQGRRVGWRRPPPTPHGKLTCGALGSVHLGVGGSPQPVNRPSPVGRHADGVPLALNHAAVRTGKGPVDDGGCGMTHEPTATYPARSRLAAASVRCRAYPTRPREPSGGPTTCR